MAHELISTHYTCDGLVIALEIAEPDPNEGYDTIHMIINDLWCVVNAAGTSSYARAIFANEIDAIEYMDTQPDGDALMVLRWSAHEENGE